MYVDFIWLIPLVLILTCSEIIPAITLAAQFAAFPAIGMKSSSGVAAKYFNALKDIPVKLVTTSEIKISCLVEEKYKNDAMQALIKMFNL